MSEHIRLYSGRRFFLVFALPCFCGAVLLSIAAVLALRWAIMEADRAAVDRQVDLMSVVVDNLRAKVSHDQESVTVWDEAVQAMRNPPSPAWIDNNLGSWMHSYFGHEGVYVLDSTNALIYAYEDGMIVPQLTFENLSPVFSRLAEKLRARLAAGDTGGLSHRVLSLGEADIGFDNGRPAIVSVKPIVSDTGSIEQTPGTEYLHVSVQFLDGPFLKELSERYLFDDLAYMPSVVPRPGWRAYPIDNAAGHPIGYYVWRPFAPGSTVFARAIPAIVAILAVLLGAVVLALFSVHRRSVAERAAAEKIHRHAFYDSLTGLPNRHAFNTWIEGILSSVQGGGTLLYIDLDHFKTVNDTLGHAVGDIVVQSVAGRLTGICGDDVFRIGGDKFIFVSAASSIRSGVAQAEAIVTALSVPIFIKQIHAFVGASIGIAPFIDGRRDGNELLRRAEVALYQAKAAGRNRVAVYDTSLDAEQQKRVGIERDLRQSIGRPEEFEVHYQPVYNAASRRLVSVEALVRWRHPERGVVPPSDFIPVAESSGLVREIGEMVLETACRAAAHWPVEAVAVNVSAVQLRDAEFPGLVADILAHAGLPAEKLEIEITETAWLDPQGHENETLAALRAMGARIAIDDFGTGFSSLGRLSETVFDRIKIDQSFVRKALASKGDAAVVQAIVDLARANGGKTTAEGVETAEAADFLTGIGCDELQGYWFGKPLPFAEIDAVFRAAAARP